MTEIKFNAKLEKIKEKNKEKLLKQQLKSEKDKYKQKKKLPSTSKLILIGAVLLCLQIIIFCEYMMWRTGDLQAMYVLIGIAASLTATCIGYFIKSKAENTTGGITYETAMEELRQSGCVQQESISDEDIKG